MVDFETGSGIKKMKCKVYKDSLVKTLMKKVAGKYGLASDSLYWECAGEEIDFNQPVWRFKGRKIMALKKLR